MTVLKPKKLKAFSLLTQQTENVEARARDCWPIEKNQILKQTNKNKNPDNSTSPRSSQAGGLVAAFSRTFYGNHPRRLEHIKVVLPQSTHLYMKT